MSARFIPLAEPDLSGNEEAYVTDAIRSGWISSTGKYVDRFEATFAQFCGTKIALSVVNGTCALHLALLGLGVGVGDEVIVPSLTYIATANAVRYVGAEPVFADIDTANWCIDPTAIQKAITPKTKGIIAVHLYGHPADMDAINAVASAHSLWVLEDAAEAHGALYKGRPAGSLATAAIFSFYGNKIVSSGEGGAITLDDPALAARLKLLRGQGMDPERRYHFLEIGYNFRLTNVACALLCAQLERAEEMAANRAAIFASYREKLANVPGIGFQPVADWARPAPWLFPITVDDELFGCSRDALMARLADNGIETRPFFPPLHLQRPYAAAWRKRGGDLSVTKRIAQTGMLLPTYAALSDADIGRVAAAVRAAGR